MNFKDSIEKIEDSPSGFPGKILVWRHSTGWPIAKDDLDAFCVHMDGWYSISNRTLSRQEYEQACRDRGIDPVQDLDIGGYGDVYGDFGMDHYHTVPENRIFGIKATLNQGRWAGMLSENPDIVEERREEAMRCSEVARIEGLRKDYPIDLGAWIGSVGGLDAIYNEASKMHENKDRKSVV